MSYDYERINIAGKIPTNILKFRRDKHDFENGWETPYLSKLADTVKSGMVVFDIGAENAEFSAMVANVVGGGNVHLFEPSPDYWPNIKAIWEVNNLKQPYCFNGFVSDKSNINHFIKELSISDIRLLNKEWPDCIVGNLFEGTNQISIGQEEYILPIISIDDYCEITESIPNIIMMDIEGAELSAIRGAEQTIKNNSPIFFISIHNDEAIQLRSNGTKQDILDIFNNYGYKAIHINTDHEEHWQFIKE